LGAKIRDLRQRIKIQSLSRTGDGQGGFTETWTDYLTLWAAVKPVSAAERIWGQRVESNVSHVITIRWTDLLTTEMRIFFENRIFQIHGIRRENEERWFMILDCVENVGS